MDYLSPAHMKLCDEFRHRVKTRPSYDSASYAESKLSNRPSAYEATTLQTETERPKPISISSSNRCSAILVEDNSHMLTDSVSSDRRHLNAFIFNETPRDSQQSRDLQRNHYTYERSYRDRELPLQSKQIPNTSAKQAYEYQRKESYDNQVDKENIDVNRMHLRSPSPRNDQKTFERKTLQNLNPHDYYNKVMATVACEDKVLVREDKVHLQEQKPREMPANSSRQFLVNELAALRPVEKPVLSFNQKLNNYLHKEEAVNPEVDEAYGRISNSKELEALYMNYIHRKKPSVGASTTRLVVPSTKKYEEELLNSRKTELMTSPKTPKAGTAMKGGSTLKKKKSSQNLSVRFSIAQEQVPSRRSVSQDRGRSSAGERRSVERVLDTAEKSARVEPANDVKMLISPRRSHSAVTKTTQDLGSPIPVHAEDRRQFLSPGEAEQILERANISSIRASTVSRPSQTRTTEESRSSIRSRESARAETTQRGTFDQISRDFEETKREIERRFRLGTIDKSKFWNLIGEQLKHSPSFRTGITDLLSE